MIKYAFLFASIFLRPAKNCHAINKDRYNLSGKNN